MAHQASAFQEVGEDVKTVFQIWLEVVDELAGGCFTRGYREPLDVERVREWDTLTPDQLTTLRDRNGTDWVIKYGAEIERLRGKIPEIPAGTPQ